jgi:lysophospholipase L1-like esterase
VSVDDQAEKIIEILPNSDPQIQINAQNPISTIKLRLVSGTIVLNGFIPAYSSPAKLILDTMAIPSATMKPWAFIDPLIFSSIQKDPYDLVIFAYGTNEGAQPNWNATQYGYDLRAALVGMRKAYPEAACVLIGPTDRGLYNQKARKQKKGVNPAKYDMLKYSKIHYEITQIQQIIGQEYACISWSWQAAMGGMGGAYQWLYASPPLMSKDLTHLTISGYQKSAQEFIKSLQLQSLFNN